MSSPGTVEGDERIRLFLALELPGARDMIRSGATAASLHLVRRLLETRHTER